MGKILVHEFMSLDGVIDTPTWTADYHWTDRMTDVIGGVTHRCTAILLGRTTYDMFSHAWPERTVEDDPGAPFFNDTVKYVVSTTLTNPSWRNTEVLDGYDATRIAQLKSDVDGDIYVSGSGSLVRALLADALVDELHVLLYPVTRAKDRDCSPPTLHPPASNSPRASSSTTASCISGSNPGRDRHRGVEG